MAKQSHRFWISVIALILLISLGLSVWATTAAPIANFYLTPMRVWELDLGALLVIGAFPELRRPLAAEAIRLIELATIIGSIVLICVFRSVLPATVSVYLIKRPFRIPASKGGLSLGLIFLGAGTGVTLILGLAVILVVKEGVPSRIPIELAAKMNKVKESHYLMDACRQWEDGKEPRKIGASDHADAEPRVVVRGDSHAGSLLPGIDSWLKDNNIPGEAFVKFG